MRQSLFLILLLVIPIWVQAQLFPALGAQRAGISALTFLKMDLSPRSAGLAGANICLTGDAWSTHTNPATAAELTTLSIGVSNTFWSAGINHSYLSVIVPTKFGNLGLGVSGVSSGKMEKRTVFQPGGTGEFFYAGYIAAGLTYSLALTERFSWGVSLKYVHEQLAEYNANTAVVDMGFLYQLDVKDLRFAVMVQSFGINSRLAGAGVIDTTFRNGTPNLESYPAPTVFKLGISLTPLKTTDEVHRLTTSLQLNHPNDNAENILFGVEYAYRNLLFLRAGYKINVRDQNIPTGGVGLRMRIGRHPLQLDYGYDPLRFLGNVHRVGLAFTLNPDQER